MLPKWFTYNAEALEQMKAFALAGMVFDLVLTDPPYGTTACKWDSIIDLPSMWHWLRRITRPTTPMIFTASQPFTSKLIMSNVDDYKFNMVWQKPQGVDPFMAKRRPLNDIEDIVVFYQKQPVYNPQFTAGSPYVVHRDKEARVMEVNGQTMKPTTTVNTGTRYPKRVLQFNQERGMHPTQKPVDLMSYLIRTWTDPGAAVLDFTMGSGTTGVAAVVAGRDFHGIELDYDYCTQASIRIQEAWNERYNQE